MQEESVLTLGNGAGAVSELLGSPPRLPYTSDEQQLSAHVQHEIDQLILGGRRHLVLLKLYPRRSDGVVVSAMWPELDHGTVRHEVVERIAADALSFFGPLHGGVVAQEVCEGRDVILQGRQFSTTYPHINLERYDFYDTATSEPLLGVWRARRIQNMRRETRTNRMIDLALLALEVGKSVFPLLVR